MIEIGAFEAKTKLPELLRKVREGKHFIITHRGKAVAELSPFSELSSNNEVEELEALIKLLDKKNKEASDAMNDAFRELKQTADFFKHHLGDVSA